MRDQVLVMPTAGQNYAASKTNTAANSATSPELLAPGALGIYTTNSSGTLTLVERTNSSRLLDLFFYVGMPDGRSPRRIAPIKTPGINSLYTVKNSAAVKSFSVVGFNGTAGTGFNLPTVAATESLYYDLGITLIDDKVPFDKTNLACKVVSTDTPFSVARKLYAKNLIRKTAYQGGNVNIDMDLGIVSNGVRTAFATAKTIAIAKGGTTFTIGEATTLAVGSFVLLQGQTYQITIANSTTLYTIDRPFHGNTISATNVNANTGFGTLASVTEAGLLVYNATAEGYIECSVIGDYNTTITNNINKAAVTIGGVTYAKGAEAVGTYDQVLQFEKESAHIHGHNTPIEVWWPSFLTTAVKDTVFDTICLRGTYIDEGSSPSNLVRDFNHTFYFASTGTDADNTNIEACLTILSTIAAFNGVTVDNKNGNIIA